MHYDILNNSGGRMTAGAQVRNRKRFKDSGGSNYHTFTNSKLPGVSQRTNCHPVNNGVKPKEPEVFSRQVIRQMLRDKAKQDIQQQYGNVTRLGYASYHPTFPKAARTRVVKAMVTRWYAQIRENCTRDGETKQRGYIKRLLRKIWGGRENTLAAGMGR